MRYLHEEASASTIIDGQYTPISFDEELSLSIPIAFLPPSIAPSLPTLLR